VAAPPTILPVLPKGVSISSKATVPTTNIEGVTSSFSAAPKKARLKKFANVL
jgi:hypothetical protein